MTYSSPFEWGSDGPPRNAKVVDPRLARWLADARWSVGLAARFSRDADGEVLIAVEPSVNRAASSSPAPDLTDLVAPDADALREFLYAARAFMERVAWPGWNDYREECANPPCLAPSHGMCRVSVAVLLPMLRAAFPADEWAADGGHPSVLYGKAVAGQFKSSFQGLDGGMWDRDRQAWDGHYWIVGRHDGIRVVVDVAADQFGWPPVVVAPPTRGTGATSRPPR